MGRLTLFGLLTFFSVLQVMAANSDNFAQRLAEGRKQYFADLQGDKAAGTKARASFAELSRDYPGNAVVVAYSGSSA
jgi:hypothetical protein